jgi:hypothetical protein
MVTGADSPTLRPHPRAAVFAALAPSSILQVPGTQAGALRAMARVVSALPCYALELGSRADLIPGVVAGLLADLRGGPK